MGGAISAGGILEPDGGKGSENESVGGEEVVILPPENLFAFVAMTI